MIEWFTELDSDTILTKLIFEKSGLPNLEDICLFVAYRDGNGNLISVNMPQLFGLYSLFQIPDGLSDCSIEVYIWYKNMKPLMDGLLQEPLNVVCLLLYWRQAYHQESDTLTAILLM